MTRWPFLYSVLIVVCAGTTNGFAEDRPTYFDAARRLEELQYRYQHAVDVRDLGRRQAQQQLLQSQRAQELHISIEQRLAADQRQHVIHQQRLSLNAQSRQSREAAAELRDHSAQLSAGIHFARKQIQSDMAARLESLTEAPLEHEDNGESGATVSRTEAPARRLDKSADAQNTPASRHQESPFPGSPTRANAATLFADRTPVPIPASRVPPSTDGKINVSVSGMTPGAKRFADYLAKLPDPPNATYFTGQPVNADRLSLPWPQEVVAMNGIDPIISDAENGRLKIVAGTPVIVGFPGASIAAGLGRASKLFSRVRARVGNTTPSGKVIHVTTQGVALPPGPRYAIPKRFVQNPHRPASYGVLDERTGKFVEKLRIDPATPRGKPGPERSHYHLNGEDAHYGPGFFDDPGFPK